MKKAKKIFWITTITVNIICWTFFIVMNHPVNKMYLGPGGVAPENTSLTVKSDKDVLPFYATAAGFVTVSKLEDDLKIKNTNKKGKELLGKNVTVYQEVAINMKETKKVNGKTKTEVKKYEGKEASEKITSVALSKQEKGDYYQSVKDAVKPYVGIIDQKIFKNDFNGASDGLMISLQIIQTLTHENLTKGKKISGTGAIDENGNVLMISCVEQKVMSAHLNKMDVFFVPKDLYDKALKEKKLLHSDLKIVPVSTLKETINYLK